MQMMIAVFDFPDRSTGNDSDEVPELIVDYLRGYQHLPGPRLTTRRHTR